MTKRSVVVKVVSKDDSLRTPQISYSEQANNNTNKTAEKANKASRNKIKAINPRVIRQEYDMDLQMKEMYY